MLPAEFERMLSQAYQSVGAFDADILYIYTDFRYFGLNATGYKDRNEFCKAIVAPFLECGKTIVLTTFTYTSEGRFDVLESRTKLGAMNKWILEQPGNIMTQVYFVLCLLNIFYLQMEQVVMMPT